MNVVLSCAAVCVCVVKTNLQNENDITKRGSQKETNKRKKDRKRNNNFSFFVRLNIK